MSKEKTSLIVNGEKLEFNQNITVEDLLVKLNYKSKWLAIQVNDKIIDRNNYAAIILKNNDIVDIIQPVGGG